MILTKLFKVEIFRLNLKNASDIKTIFPKYKKIGQICPKKKYSMRFYLFCLGDLVTLTTIPPPPSPHFLDEFSSCLTTRQALYSQ